MISPALPDGSQLAMMIVNPDLPTEKVLKFYYDAEGIPMCLDYNGTIYFYITNLQGDVVALADQYGEVIRYEYDAWGKPINSSAVSGWNEILLSDTYLCFCCFNATKSRGTMVL